MSSVMYVDELNRQTNWQHKAWPYPRGIAYGWSEEALTLSLTGFMRQQLGQRPFPCDVDHEDVMQGVALAAARCARSYDVEKGWTFVALGGTSVIRELNRLRERECRRANHAAYSLDDATDELTQMRREVGELDDYTWIDDENVEGFLSALPPLAQRILRLRLDGLLWKEIAPMVGLSLYMTKREAKLVGPYWEAWNG